MIAAWRTARGVAGVALVLLLLDRGPPQPYSPPPSEYTRVLDRAQRSQRSGNLVEAHALADRAIALAPRHVAAHAFKIAMLLDAGEAWAAQAAGADAIRQTHHPGLQCRTRTADTHLPDHPHALFLAGVIALYNKAVPTAIAQFQRAQAQAPLVADLHYFLGVAYWRADERQFSIPEYVQAYMIAPNHVGALRAMGHALMENQMYHYGLTMLQRAHAVQPDNHAVNYSLGDAHLRRGEYPEARMYFERTVQLEPNAAEALVELGKLAAGEQRHAQATAYFQRAVDADPTVPQGWCELGAALARDGQLPEAEAALRRAVDVAPRYAKAHYQLGQVLLRLGRHADARAHLTTFQRLSAQQAAALVHAS